MWKPFKEIDFDDININQYHIDTRDFCCSVINETVVDFDYNHIIKELSNNFIHSDKEVVSLLNRLFDESGGEKEWRSLYLMHPNPIMDNWNMKYIRIYRIKLGLIVCDSDNNILNKEILSSNVNQEIL